MGISKENVYKYKDKKMLKEWLKGQLINLIIQLIDLIYEDE